MITRDAVQPTPLFNRYPLKSSTPAVQFRRIATVPVARVQKACDIDRGHFPVRA